MLDTSEKLSWKKRARNSTKMVFSAFISQFMKDQYGLDAKQSLEKVLIAKGHNAFKNDE